MMKLLDNLAAITTVPRVDFSRLESLSEALISQELLESLSSEDSALIDLGIGKLTLELDSDSISYHFVPSKSLEKELVNTLKEKRSKLEVILQEALTNKLLKAYKDLVD